MVDLLIDSDEELDHNNLLPHVKIREFKNTNQVLYAGTALQICLAMEGLLVSPHLTDIAQDFGLDARARDFNLGGLLSLVILLVSLPASALIGYLGDTRDRKMVIFGLAMLGAASNTLVAIVHVFPLFVALRCLSTVSSMSNIVFVSLIAEMYTHRERGVVLGNYNAIRGTGVGLGVLVSTVSGHHSWRVSFVLVGVLSFAAAMFFCGGLHPVRHAHVLQVRQAHVRQKSKPAPERAADFSATVSTWPSSCRPPFARCRLTLSACI